MKRKRWTEPAWMKPYTAKLVNTGGHITPESAMNCDSKNCNLVVNAPRAVLCLAVQSQVLFLTALHDAGMLR